ncbi:unnamed protein product [Amaranthus hypochondriacus]
MQQQPSSSSSLSNSKWIVVNYISKLLFFLKTRRFFLQPKKRTKRRHASNNHNNTNKTESLETKTEEIMKGKIQENQHNTDQDQGGLLQKTVKEILFGKREEKENAVKEIKRLANEDVKVRRNLGELGVIPPLISMIDSHAVSVSQRCLAVQALTQLSNGTFTNKALILEAGILAKLPTNIEELEDTLCYDLSQLLLSISSLFNTYFPFKLHSTLISFLLNILQSNKTTNKSKEACLGTLYNLSNVLENSGPLISNHVVDILLSLLSSSRDKILEQSLAILGNLVVTLIGKKALEENEAIPECLIDILVWENRPKCQELSIYVLMILGHQSSKQRDKMAKLGIVHTLLEVSLLGSPLAQKRALKLLQWFKDERHVKVGPHSGPQTRSISMGLGMSDGESNEGKRLMKKMVQQSLYKNMEVITRRANTAGECSKFKSLVVSSSSKSLPY